MKSNSVNKTGKPLINGGLLELERTTKFKRVLKRELKGQYANTLKQDLKKVIDLLVKEEPLPAKYKDHLLMGSLKACRDCHIKPDLVLIYRKLGNGILTLIRLGSHSELF